MEFSAATPVFTLSASAYQVVWERLELPEMPIVVSVNPRGYEEDERRAVVNTAWDELRSAGLVSNDGVHAELERLLHLMARPERSVDARLWLGHEVRALAAGRGEHAVLAVLADDYLTAQSIYPGGLAREAVGLLPAHPAGSGRSVSVLSKALDAAAASAGSSVKALEAALRDHGVGAFDASHLAQMVDGAAHRGQFGAAVTDRLGRRQRADHVVAFHDTPSGRYLMEQHRAGDGQSWTTITPTDSRRLAAQVERLVLTLDPVR